MIPTAIKARLNAAPFRPFDLRLGSGQTFAVQHPESVSLAPGGRHLILWVGENEHVDLDVLLIESITSTRGNGHSRCKAS